MAETVKLEGPEQGPAAGGPPRSVVALLHGLGADGNDLFGLVPYFAQLLPHTHFIAPDAPEPCDMAPFGRQWFSLIDRTPENVLAGVQRAAPILDGFIDDLLARLDLPPEKLALVGFSQGTMMSLHVAPRRPAPIACVLAYSGRLVNPDALATEIRSRPPVYLIHGDADPIVPVDSLPAARAALEANDVPVDTEIRPGVQHSIDEHGLQIGMAFLQRFLGRE